ncbi:MAG: hypothetical protein Q7J24_03470 [Desulfomicrobium sp.]|nr:hypothetical protein [Desulfomicrobium sp.]
MKDNLRRHKWLYLSWVLIFSVILIFAASGIRMTKLSMDPLTQLGQPFYLGMISNLGILLWMATASVTLFSSFHLKPGVAHPQGTSFLRWVAILSLMLMCDDLLMLHEQVFPEYLHVPEIMVYVIYLVYTSLFFLKFWRLILSQANYKFLILAFFFFGMSIIIDLDMFPGGIDIEDSFKILGLTTYAYYFITLSSNWLKENHG